MLHTRLEDFFAGYETFQLPLPRVRNISASHAQGMKHFTKYSNRVCSINNGLPLTTRHINAGSKLRVKEQNSMKLHYKCVE